MDVRDAIETDASRLSSVAGGSTDAMRNLIHDRTVRVAEEERTDADPNRDAGDEDDEDPSLLGFVSFDATGSKVHVTQLHGTVDARERLLGEPIRFARSEGMPVELLVPESEEDTRRAAAEVGFEPNGDGPRFDGEATIRYRLDPTAESGD